MKSQLGKPSSTIVKAIRTEDVAGQIEVIIAAGGVVSIGTTSVGPVRLATGESYYELIPSANLPAAFAHRSADPWPVAWKFASVFGWRAATRAVRRYKTKDAA